MIPEIIPTIAKIGKSSAPSKISPIISPQPSTTSSLSNAASAISATTSILFSTALETSLFFYTICSSISHKPPELFINNMIFL